MLLFEPRVVDRLGRGSVHIIKPRQLFTMSVLALPQISGHSSPQRPPKGRKRELTHRDCSMSSSLLRADTEWSSGRAGTAVGNPNRALCTLLD